MKKIIFILIFFMACGDIGEQKIGYVEIVENAWSLFSDGDYQSARTEFTNALDYKVLNNISEAYIGIGWCNLYIANEFTDLTNTSSRNALRDLGFNNFENAQENNDESLDKISNELNAILSAGFVFVYDYQLLDFNDQYFNEEDFICGSNGNEYDDIDEFRRDCIIPKVIDIIIESERLFSFQENFEFPYDNTINSDDIHFIRARLAYSFNDFTSLEFLNNETTIPQDDLQFYNHEEIYYQEEICLINDLTQECIDLGFDQYCIELYPNIPVEKFLGCLSSFYTPTSNP